MKKKILVIFLIIAIVVLVYVLMSNRKKVHFDINEPIGEYNLSSEYDKKQYKGFIKNHLMPEKLKNYVLDERIILNTSINGQGVLSDMKHEAYNQLFYQIFNEKVKLKEAPVTDNFISKFKDGVKKVFNIEAEEIFTTVDTVDKKINVECRTEFDSMGEPQKIEVYKFSYELDENGNVDDVILLNKEII